MQLLDSGKDKVRKICEALKKETLEPAQKQADELIESAHKEAEGIVARARTEGERLLAQAKEKIASEKRVFESALSLGAKQAIASLKQAIETKLFSEQIRQIVKEKTASSDVIATCISTLVEASQSKSGMEMVLPRGVQPKEVIAALAKKGLSELANAPYTIGGFSGGARLKLAGEHVTLDLSDEAISSLLASYLKEEFRHLLFGSK